MNVGLFVRTVIFLVTGVATFFVYLVIAARFGSEEPLWMATLLMGSVVIHECAHALMMSLAGLKPLMFFAVIIGGAMPTQMKKMSSLPWGRQAGIVLAGPFSNVLLVGVGALLYLGDVASLRQFEQIAAINTELFLLNLLPFSILDGGRFAKLFFDSVPEHLDMSFTRVTGLVVIFMAVLVSVLRKEPTLFTAGFIYFGLIHRAKNDDPKGSRHRLAIKRSEQLRWAFFYGSMLALGIVLYNMLPPWMA